ncbi:bidirectional sugar transporter SWEET3-like [Abrus precatorius]|uniref:Bidirectional sugar transporter SWEET n=1 Tax=Abrus precatorius TaxID=3816 RepID=A0A8B8M2E7_ABRPR|nr:bidirectional sugar transporter SWEET3-like [Abrus precatorius]
MSETLRLAIAAFGIGATIALYAAPLVAFKRKESTQEFFCLLSITGLLNCLLFTWYGLPVVSHNWENLPLIIVNGVGILFHLSYILVYSWHASARGKVKVAMTTIPVLLVFCIIVAISALGIHDYGHRKLFVGSIGLVASAAMYGYPLKKGMETKSVEFMPLTLSMCSFLASGLWLIYGLVIRDIFVAGPNAIGIYLGILQVVLNIRYRNVSVFEELNRGDLENCNTKEVNLQKRRPEFEVQRRTLYAPMCNRFSTINLIM